MNRREAERILAALHAVRATKGTAALATVVRVHGHAYRREGATMVIRPDGTYEGALSGGCLEPAVADAATRVVETGVAALVTYDLADDSPWGLNLGCSGAVDILIAPVEDDPVTGAWMTALARGTAMVLVTALTGVTGRRLIVMDTEPIGALSNPALHEAVDREARALLGRAAPASGTAVIGGAHLYVDVHEAPPSLVIFGAGLDAVPLADQGWALGFDVTVVDPRAAYLQPTLFPRARRVLAPFADLPRWVALPRGAFVVIMNHHLERDRQALRFSLESEATYVGVLGPTDRFERLVRDLAAHGFVPSVAQRTRVHSPVGLALGAETPDEVALSILAEVVAVRRRFAGGFLDDLHRGPAHDGRASAPPSRRQARPPVLTSSGPT